MDTLSNIIVAGWGTGTSDNFLVIAYYKAGGQLNQDWATQIQMDYISTFIKSVKFQSGV
jgi:hypothetical protein